MEILDDSGPRYAEDDEVSGLLPFETKGGAGVHVGNMTTGA
jgi:hypothetical protein